MTTVWYGKSSSKQLQQLLDSKPRFIQLLNFNQFVQELKSYNTKLLDYITNNPSLISQAIELITTSPSYNDTNDRKFKYPLQTVQIIETQTTCILNSFFKQSNSITKNQYFDQLFNILDQSQVLPLLAGYFFRTNICLLNNRYKQTLDRVYLKPQLFKKLLNHCHLMPIVNTIQLYLNLDINKSPDTDNSRLECKKNIFNQMIMRIQQQRKAKRFDSPIIIQNLVTVFIETIEKYYLILDGKTLVQILTAKQCIDTMFALIRENWEGAYAGFNFFISLINYYSFSSYNADQTDPQKKAKNLQRLQAQPMVMGLKKMFPIFLDQIMKKNAISLYDYKLLEILCHCISLSSEQILKTMKQTRFFSGLTNLLFKHQDNNILHMLIEKSFLHVFISQRKIYDQYKHHLFCELDIIQITAYRVLKTYSQQKIFELFRKKSFFGHFMRILKIYSGIQTTEEQIINAIKAKTQVWNKISSNLIKPYQSICFKQLGSYQGIPQSKYQQFEVKKANQMTAASMTRMKPLSSSMIEQIRKQDEFLPPLKSQQKQLPLPNPIKQQIIYQKKKQQQLLKAPTHNLTTEIILENKIIQQSLPPRQIKKVESFKQFMSKKKIQAENQIKLKRSLSHQKRLSGSRGKITNASPKKNNWIEKSDNLSTQANDTKSIDVSSFSINPNKIPNDVPRIPQHSQRVLIHSPRIPNPTTNSLTNQTIKIQNTANNSYYPYNSSTISVKNSDFTSRNIQQVEGYPNTLNTSQSDKTLQIIKKIKVIQIQAPKQKKYRRIQQKDRVLLDFLGITTGNSLNK